MSGGVADIQFAIVNSARYGIENYGTAELTNIELAYNNNYGIYQRGGDLKLLTGRLHRNSTGIYITGGKSKIEFAKI